MKCIWERRATAIKHCIICIATVSCAFSPTLFMLRVNKMEREKQSTEPRGTILSSVSQSELEVSISGVCFVDFVSLFVNGECQSKSTP